MQYDAPNKPEDWPSNGREAKLDGIWDLLDDFEKKPSYKTRELLLALVSDNDIRQSTSYGAVRFTEYEVSMINLIYMRAALMQINSVKVFLYDMVTEATRLQKVCSRWSHITGSNDTYQIIPYEEGLFLPLKLYHFAYQKYTVFKDASFAEQILSVVQEIYDESQGEEELDAISFAYSAMLNDISYMRGNKKERLWEFERDELMKLFELEAQVMQSNRQNPSFSPTRGVLMTQISNFILKSRNNYNQDYICKYLSKTAVSSSVINHEIWMNKTENLNDKREQKVIPELFADDSWISFTWAKNVDFTPVRTYFVSSFSKTIGTDDMRAKYGECLYGYKNDRIVDLIGPIMLHKFEKKPGADSALPDKKEIPAIAQVIAFDVLYDREEARKELDYLFEVINLFDMTAEEKHGFLESILQYWILSVKDDDWKDERERRYVLFLYDDYDYIETVEENGFLKEKTSLFVLPDFILGDNPVKDIIRKQTVAKQKATMVKEYLYCHNCLMQDYDSICIDLHLPTKCPICGSEDVEIVQSEI